jgi:hypothetical protein
MEQSVAKRRHIKFRRRGIYPEENMQNSEQGESLKSSKHKYNLKKIKIFDFHNFLFFFQSNNHSNALFI